MVLCTQLCTVMWMFNIHTATKVDHKESAKCKDVISRTF